MDYKKILKISIIILIVLRLASIFFIQGFTDDEMVYMGLGRSLSEGLGYGYINEPFTESYRPPLMSFLLSMVYFVSGPSDYVSILISSLFGIFSILAIYFLGKKMYNESLALFAALLLAANPLHWFYSIKVLTESLLILLGILMIYFFYVSLKDSRYLIPTVGILALLFLTKYTGLIFSIFFIAYIIFKKKDYLLNRNLWIGVILGLVILSPWLYMNHNIYGNALGYTFDLASGAATGTTYDVDKSSLYGIMDLSVGPFFYIFSIPITVALFLPLVILGFYWMTKKRDDKYWFLLLFVIIFLVLLSLLELRKYRYLMPVIPIFTIYAAFAFERIRKKNINKYIAPLLLSVLVVGNVFIVYYEFSSHPKIDKYIGLQNAGLYLNENCQNEKIYTNAFPYTWWYTHEKAYDVKNVIYEKDICILLNKYDYYDESKLEFIENNFEEIFEYGQVSVYKS